MKTPVYSNDLSRPGLGPLVGSVEISDDIDARTLANTALTPQLRKDGDNWVVVGWDLVYRQNVDTRFIELT